MTEQPKPERENLSSQLTAITAADLVKATDEIAKKLAVIELSHHEKVLRKLDDINAHQADMKLKIDPMYEIFSSVGGFNKIAMWILKFLAAVGGGILALYVVIEFFKKLGK